MNRTDAKKLIATITTPKPPDWDRGIFTLESLKKAAEQIREATKYSSPTRITLNEMGAYMVLGSIRVGNLEWTNTNLCLTDGKNDVTATSGEYGYLYTLESAKRVATMIPEWWGWRVPTFQDVSDLFKHPDRDKFKYSNAFLFDNDRPADCQYVDIVNGTKDYPFNTNIVPNTCRYCVRLVRDAKD